MEIKGASLYIDKKDSPRVLRPAVQGVAGVGCGGGSYQSHEETFLLPTDGRLRPVKGDPSLPSKRLLLLLFIVTVAIGMQWL